MANELAETAGTAHRRPDRRCHAFARGGLVCLSASSTKLEIPDSIPARVDFRYPVLYMNPVFAYAGFLKVSARQQKLIKLARRHCACIGRTTVTLARREGDELTFDRRVTADNVRARTGMRGASERTEAAV
ncbi:unnamed protein product [Soboliphyme baturini]|uniref:PAS domain-containing protein n=1 Tax=Soboliphyme baturini TaxID=241478 RepID=A0A183IT96_9BILA|nr:unnamed protein product [Soboliphyme baturini]